MTRSGLRGVRAGLLTVVIGGIPIAVLALATVTIAERAIGDEVDQRMRTTATVSAHRIDEAITAGSQPVVTSASSPAMTDLAGGLLDGTIEDDVAAAALQPSMRRAIVLGAFIADLDGRLLTSVGAPTQDQLRADWVRELSTDRESFVSDAAPVEGRATGVAAILSTIRDDTGAPVAVLGVLFDLRTIQAFVDDDASGDDVMLTVLDRSGSVVAEPVDVPAAAATSRDDGLTRRTVDGERLLGAQSTAESVGWTVIAETPASIALARVDDVRQSVALVAALLLLGLVVVGGFVVRADRRRRQAEEEWRLAHERAIDASLHKSEFLANMSHEIRTPLNGVLGLTSLLVDSDLTADQRELAEMAHRSGEALLVIINEVLDFSRIEAGRITVEIIDFDLRSLVEDVSRLLAASAETKGIELVCAVDEAVPSRLKGDPTRIRQILTNLAGNAVKFTEQGSVVIRASVEPVDDDQVLARIEVTDTGLGIDERAQPKLFEPFTQADASTTRRFGGSGLGLSISQRLAHLMGGDIGLHSKLGVGSTFWFTVPLGRADDAAPATKPPVLGDLEVLIVDDNETNRRVLERQVTGRGLRARTAGDGTAALTTLRELAAEAALPDIVLLDLNMPDMDGFAVSAQIRETYGAEPRIILLTSSAQRGEARRSQEAGIDGYLSKPVRRSELFDVMAMVMGRGPDRDQLVTRHFAREASRRARILLAEDNPVNQRVASTMLERLGYSVTLAANGADAVDAYDAGVHDAILMDCQMPVMDGFEATRQLRAKGATVPIIALTASATTTDRQACLDAGMNDHISKPIQPAVLETTLEQWLDDEPDATPADETRDLGPRPAIVDESVIRAIVDLDGEELLHTLIETFESDAAEQLATIRAALDTGDLTAVRGAAHRMKGGSAAIGATAASAACAQLEQAADANRAAVVASLLADVEKVIVASLEALRAWTVETRA